MNYYFSESLLINQIPGFHFLQDHIGTNYKTPWNDYDYIITFKLYYVPEDDIKKNIGSLKILAKEHEDTSSYFKKNGVLVNDKTFDIKEILKSDLVISIGEDLDFYNKLHSLFNEGKAEEVLSKICDAGYHNDKFSDFSSWSGFSGSFMRGSASSAILKKGFQIALGRYAPEAKFDINLTDLGDSFEDVCLRFDTSKEIGKSNINLLIGKNGVGKSHILKKISETITGIIDTNNNLPYFHKLIMIAFSPFESFYTKDEVSEKLSNRYLEGTEKSNNKSKQRKRLHVNEYAYIGFRNEDGIHDLNHPVIQSIKSLIKVIDYDDKNDWWTNKSRLQILKETLLLCIDFDSMAIIDSENNEIEISSTLDESKFKNKIRFDLGIIFKKNNTVLPLSSGQKIYSYMLPAIIAELEDESLLILDEPELYLHPELEVGLINMLQHVLKETKSYSIIATHSAIIAREVDRTAINILRKSNGRTETHIANIETYGESLDVILSEVFDDFYVTKPYQMEIERYLIESNENISAIKSHIGDDALAYALSIIQRNDDDIIIEGN